MQPTYMPWVGYFNYIDQADYFVFLDNVQFQKQSWQQRNQLRGLKGLEWITVPVYIKNRFGQLIREVAIKQDRFPEKHIKQIRQNYSRAPYFKLYADEFFALLEEGTESGSLCELSIMIIEWLCAKLSISTSFVLASDLHATGKRTELLVNILDELGATTYISPRGSMGYLQEALEHFEQKGISVLYDNYEHPMYSQPYTPFVPYASTFDLLVNEGEKAGAILRSGHRPFTSAREV